MKSIITLSVVMLMLSGCASTVEVEPVSVAEFSIDNTVCIEKNPKVNVKDFVQILQAGMTKLAIQSQVYEGATPADCVYVMRYQTRHSWDTSSYLSYVQLNLFSSSQAIGKAVYHYKGHAFSPDLTKWQETASKVDPLVQQLFAEFCTQDCED